MAKLNFPTPDLGNPATLTYTDAGITWTWNDALGVWSSDLGGSGDEFLSKVNDDTAAGEITFAEQTTHENGIRVTSGEVLCQTDGVDGFVSVQPSGISTGKAYSTELGLSRERVFIARSGGIINSELYADPTEDGSTNGKWLNVIAANYYNSGGLTVSPSGQKPAAITANSIFQNDFDSTKTGNDLTKYGFLSKTNSNYSQKDLDPNVPDDAKKIATATGFGAWNNGKVKNYRAFEFLNGGSTGINNIGFYSQLDIKNNADNYSNYHGGTAPNFFQGLTEHASGVRVTGGDETTIQRGIGITSDDRLALINDNKAIATFGKDGLTYGMYLNSDLQLTQTGTDPNVIHVDYYGTGHLNTAELSAYGASFKSDVGCNLQLFSGRLSDEYPQTADGITVSGFNSNVSPAVVTGAGSKAYNFYASGAAPNYFKGNIECDGKINGTFSLRMESDNPAAFQTTYSADSEGNQVENQEYIGTTEDLLSIIKDLRARVAQLEADHATMMNNNNGGGY